MIDELTETRGRGNKESIGQGIANIVNGFFGGMGGCAMIGQSIINIRGGGRGRLSGITAALCLLGFVVFGAGLVGIIVSALVFAWQHGKVMHAVRKKVEGRTHYHLEGPLFFGSVTSFKNLFDFQKDKEHVVIDFSESRIWDHSGIEALQNITERYGQYGKKLHLLNLSKDCQLLLDKAESIVELSVIEDLDWHHIADDRLE